MQGATEVRAYIPEGQWYDAFSNASLTGGGFVDIDCPLGQVSVLSRGGSIIPLHQGGLTSAEVHNSTFNLIVAMPELVSKSLPVLLTECRNLRTQ